MPKPPSEWMCQGPHLAALEGETFADWPPHDGRLGVDVLPTPPTRTTAVGGLSERAGACPRACDLAHRPLRRGVNRGRVWLRGHFGAACGACRAVPPMDDAAPMFGPARAFI